MSNVTDPIPQIIGVGNPMRGDDGVAAAVVKRLQAENIPAMAFDVDGTELMDMWAGETQVIMVDAAVSGAAAGTVHRFEAHEEELPQNFFRHSTHQFGVAEAVEMARVLGRLPENVIIYGVEGADFALGAGLSRDVERAVDEVVLRIKSDIAT